MTTFNNQQAFQCAEERERSLLKKLPALIEFSQTECEHYQAILKNVNAEQITSRAELARLPITRKSDLLKLQKQNFPFAGMNAKSANISRIFQSPGPIYDPESDVQDWWRLGQAFNAAGFNAGDIVQNCLSYHLTPGGFILDSGARACGCSVIPAGPGQTEQQLDVIEHLKPQGYCGTPSFLKIILDKAKQQKRNVSSVTKALVTGEAFPESLRTEFSEQGINVLQAFATADIGLIGYESQADNGLIIGEDIIVEIVRPGSLEPVAEGEVGEIVVTSFNKDYPLIRFATGDLSATLKGQSPCGRTNMRIKGWMGRADQTTKVKGMFVHPEQIEKVRLQHGQIAKVRLLVSNENNNDHLHLQCEAGAEYAEEISRQTEAVIDSLKQITKLTGTVEWLPQGQLANDGIVIEDTRTFT